MKKYILKTTTALLLTTMGCFASAASSAEFDEKHKKSQTSPATGAMAAASASAPVARSLDESDSVLLSIPDAILGMSQSILVEKRNLEHKLQNVQQEASAAAKISEAQTKTVKEAAHPLDMENFDYDNALRAFKTATYKQTLDDLNKALDVVNEVSGVVSLLKEAVENGFHFEPDPSYRLTEEADYRLDDSHSWVTFGIKSEANKKRAESWDTTYKETYHSFMKLTKQLFYYKKDEDAGALITLKALEILASKGDEALKKEVSQIRRDLVHHGLMRGRAGILRKQFVNYINETMDAVQAKKAKENAAANAAAPAN